MSIPKTRRALARFTGVEPRREHDEEGVVMSFRPEYARLGVEQIDAYAPLGPEVCMPAVDGLGKVLRVLRAARIAVPEDPNSLIGKLDTVIELLTRAVGTRVALELRPRSRIVFEAWTDEGVERVDDVAEVVETPEAYLVFRQRGRFPLRLDRADVIRQHTDCLTWFEIVTINRP